MPKKETTLNPPRFQAASLLAQRFIGDYEDTVQRYELSQQLELTEHLLDILALFRQYVQEEQDAVYTRYREKEETLLKKYGKTLQPYFDKQFYKYFYFETVLSEKGMYSSEAFNRLTSAEQGLTVNEIHQFAYLCHNALYNAKTFLYLRMEPEVMGQTIKETALPEIAELDKEITKARQLLAIYYLLKAGFNIEHRSTHAVSAVARLVHLLTGTKLTTLQNSDIYKKYARIPEYKEGELLIADLNFIRSYFVDLNIEEAVKLIDEEIARNQKGQAKHNNNK